MCVCVCMTELHKCSSFCCFCYTGEDPPLSVKLRRAFNCSTELQLLATSSYVQPSDGAGSYTVCGTPHPNYAEYKVVGCALGMAFFWQTLFRSSPPPFLPPSTKLKLEKCELQVT